MKYLVSTRSIAYKPIIMTQELKNLIDPDGRFYDVIAPVIDDLGYRLIRVAFAGTDPKRGAILNIAIEPKDGSKLKVDDCKIVSQDLSAVMDVADPIPDNYVLEVGSAGLDRPLTNKSDFDRFKGYEGKFECKRPDDNGQRKYRGFIQDVNDAGFVIQTTDRGDLQLDWSNLSMARLVASDQLLKDLQDGKV
jgi:ribosome maturation factor RimP